MFLELGIFLCIKKMLSLKTTFTLPYNTEMVIWSLVKICKISWFIKTPLEIEFGKFTLDYLRILFIINTRSFLYIIY